MSLRCPYTWLVGVTYPAPGGLDTSLGTAHARPPEEEAIFMKQGAILSSPYCDHIMHELHCDRLCSVTATHNQDLMREKTTSASYRGSGQARVPLECPMQQAIVTCTRAAHLMSKYKKYQLLLPLCK